MKVNAQTGAAVAAIELANSHVFNSLSITRDNKYLLYSTGVLLKTDINDLNGYTTIGMLSASDLSSVATPMLFAINDNNQDYRQTMIDRMLLFEDN